MHNAHTDTQAMLRRPAPFLGRHAVERVLERSTRAPTWLSDVLRATQFVHLRVGASTGKRYVLVFDPLPEVFLVAILAPGSQRVITLLTQNQYESVHGVIAPVLLQLAQLARVQTMMLTENGGVSDAAVGGKDEPLSPWNSTWRAVLAIAARNGIKKRRVRLLLDTPWRQQCILDALGVAALDSPLPGGGCARDLTLYGQAEILAKTEAFQRWIANQLSTLQENPEFLRSVGVTSRHRPTSKVDVTSVLLAQLAA